MTESIKSNREILKRVMNSEESVFCFFRHIENRTSIFQGPKYDTLIIEVHQRHLIKLILNLSGGGTFKKTFYCKYHKRDTKLYEEISKNNPYSYSDPYNYYRERRINEIYNSRRPELFGPIGEEVELNEKGIATFIELASFDMENYYKFFTKRDFVRANFEKEIEVLRDFKNVNYPYEWKIVYKYGLIFRERHFLHRYSDCGSENYAAYLIGNPAYFSTDQLKMFHYYIKPGDRYPVSDEFWEDVYDHYFGDKDLVLVNFDDMPPEGPGYNHIAHRKFCAPEEIMSRTFLLTMTPTDKKSCMSR